MRDQTPIFNSATHYRIEVQGRVDAEWLQSFDGTADIIVDETIHRKEITVLNVSTDQAGIVGLVRRLHGLGLAILQFQIVTMNENADDGEAQI